MAEREGFEPSEPLRAHLFSRQASSTTPASLRTRAILAGLCGNVGAFMLSLPLFHAQSVHVPVAQLDRASACGAEGRRFESCRVHQALA
jgi:hypothetical protein